MGDKETKTFDLVKSCLFANTVTGCVVWTTYSESGAMTFIPGEHWDEENQQLMPIGCAN